MPIQLRAQVAPTYSMPRFESGNISAPTIAFDASQSTGLSYADGIAVSHNGAQVLHVGNTVTVDAVLVGNGAGLSGIHASNVVGLTAALDTIDASSVTANTFAGDGSGLSNIAAANVTGLTAALDVIDASSVSSNVFIGDGSGLSNISTANLAGNLTVDDLTVATLSSHLLPSANVTYDLGNPTQRFRDLFLAGNTIDLAGALIQALGANVFIQNLDVGTITGDGSGLTGISIPPSINTITITDSSWNPIDDLALSTSSTGYVTIEGNNFEPVGTTVSVGGTAAASVSLVGGTQLRVSVNPKTTGTYDLVVQTGAGYAIKVNAVSFDPIPIWQTGTSLGDVYGGTPFSITLAASDGGSSITYANTTALPPSTTLATNGTLSGTITQPSSTTYNFSVEAIDAQLQSAALRTFSLNFFLLDGSTSARAAASAAAIKDSTGTTTDGVYWIIHNGSPLQVYCDMNFDGGGWMMVTRNTTNSWGWNVWGSNSDLEYASNNNDFYSNMRRNRSYTAVMFKWSGNQVSYAASSSSLKDVTGGVYPRRTGTSLPTSGLGALGTRNENYLYQRISCPVHRGYVFSNYLNNSQNQGGFMEWCGQYANTSSFINLGEIYIR
jgi:hypothetical protein